MYYIFIEELEVQTIIGAYSTEREHRQILTFDIEAAMRNQNALTSDKLSDTIDYAAVADLVREELADHSFTLLEPLANHLVDLIASKYDAVRVKLKVAKKAMVPGARQVGVILERHFD